MRSISSITFLGGAGTVTGSNYLLSDEECKETCSVVRNMRSAEESKSLNERHGPMIIISASGLPYGSEQCYINVGINDPNFMSRFLDSLSRRV